MAIQQDYIYNKMNKDGTNSYITTLTFDTTFNSMLTEIGQMGWNGDEGTFNIKTSNNSTLQLGQETVYYGVATEYIPNAAVVMIAGVQGDRIKFANATSTKILANPKAILGISTIEMQAGEYGYVTQIGNVNNVTTLAAWAPEDTLYFDIELSYLKNFNSDYLAKYQALALKKYLVSAVGGSSTINSSGVATLYFASTQGLAPFANGSKISVRGVVASGANNPNIYNVEQSTVINCTTTYVTYQTIVTSLPGGTLTVTTAGLIDTKTIAEYGEMNGVINTLRNSVANKTSGENVTTGTGTIIDPYLLDETAWNTFYTKYTVGVGVPKLINGQLTNLLPSSGLLAIPMATVVLKSDYSPAGRILVRPDIGLTLGNISDVKINSPLNQEILSYNAATRSWVNSPAIISTTSGGSGGIITGNLEVSGNGTIGGSFTVKGGSLDTDLTQATFSLINQYATTVNAFGGATTLNLGAATGTLNLRSSTIAGIAETQNLWNTVATTINFGGAATTLNLGGASTQLKLPTSLLTNAGDMIVASSAGTPTRVPAGTAGQTLKATGTGVQWSDTSAGVSEYTAGDVYTAAGFIGYSGTSVTTPGKFNSNATAPVDETKRLNFNGIFYATKVYGAVFNDYAEFMLKDEPLQAGDVVIKNESGTGYIKSRIAYDPRVVGVYSDNYGHCIGADPVLTHEENLEAYAAVGLAGRVKVKVTGEVKVGDLLVASSVPGVAMASKQFTPGTVIGKALEANREPNITRIEMLIMNV